MSWMYNIICQQITNACGQSIPILGMHRMNCTDALNSGVRLESTTYQVFPKNSPRAVKNWTKLPPKHTASVAESPHTPLTSGFKPSEVEAVELEGSVPCSSRAYTVLGSGSPQPSPRPLGHCLPCHRMYLQGRCVWVALESWKVRRWGIVLAAIGCTCGLRRQERVGRRDDGFLISSSGT
jgi:hypothetical protein